MHFPHLSLTDFYALLEGFFWDAPQIHHYGTSDGLHAFKMSPLEDPLEIGKKNKSHKARLDE